MTSADRPVLAHDGPWTEAAYFDLAASALIRGDGRVELVDGALLVGPGTTPERMRVVERVRAAIEKALPDGLRVAGPVALRLGPDCVLVPDLVVTRTSAGDGAGADGTPAGTGTDGGPERAGAPAPTPAPAPDDAGRPAPDVLDAEDALMVVEVVGREHGAADRLFKPQVYARSRIPYSVLVDHDGPFAVADMIISGRYHEYARASGDAVLAVEEPFPLAIPLNA